MALSPSRPETKKRWRETMLRVGAVVVGILTLITFILGEFAQAAEPPKNPRGPKSCLLAILGSDHPLDLIEKEWGERSLVEIYQGMSAAEIEAHNRKLERALTSKAPLVPGEDPKTRTRPSRWAPQLKFRQATSLHDQIRTHPVLTYEAIEKRDPDMQIGFCFGRATACHLEGIRRGLHPRSMRKIWVVGDMKDEQAFHVATMVKADADELIPMNLGNFTQYDETEWLVLDANFSQPLPVEMWMSSHSLGKDRKPNLFFVTQPGRFAAHSTARYNKIDLFGEPGEDDFYRGFFTDYFKTLRSKDRLRLFTEEQP